MKLRTTKVEIDNITVAFGAMTVPENLSLTIPTGAFFTLLGPSGCGKTTLLRVIAGFTEPKKGNVRFGAQDMTHVVPHKRNTGLVFQDYALFPHHSVFENVAYGLRARDVDAKTIKDKVNTYLDRVGLLSFAERAPSEPSGGQRQRVALARSLVIEPTVLLMDEPLSALDANLHQEMRLFLSEIQREVGVTTVFVTHDQEEALAMSDVIALMRDGAIEQMADPHTLHNRPKTARVASFVGAANLLPITVRGLEGDVAHCELFGTPLTVASNGMDRGADVKLCVHHHEARLAPAGETAFEAVVKTSAFLGGQVSYEVELAQGETLSITQTTGFSAPEFARGDKVSVALSSDCCLVSAS
ncbi:MAG: ABC transporter ATP-binding protein [Paracoccaceae bacterium]|nr:ABC transporter ATP-binding protein [Paracoccaceae bacterium]